MWYIVVKIQQKDSIFGLWISACNFLRNKLEAKGS